MLGLHTEETVMNDEAANDGSEVIDLNPTVALERIDSWLDGLIRLLPNIVIAIVLLVIAIVVAVFARRLIIRTMRSRDRENLGEVMGGLVKWAVIIFGGLIAATLVFPTLKPGDLIAGLGVSSVAIGFAFKDILQNWLAGLLILLRQPFEIDDQIEVDGFEGSVERIETRATIIKTYDGQRVVMPNSDIYTNAVLVKTANPKRRSQYDIGIGYGDDIDQATTVILEAISNIDGVEQDPAPEAFAWDLAASWVTIRARWWTKSSRADVVSAQAKVIKAVKQALDDAGIDMPFDTQVQLFHDQSEEADGDRSAQREGWPGSSEKASRPRRQEKAAASG